MLKKFFIIFSTLLILTSGMLIILRKNIFISTVRIWLSNKTNTSCEFIIKEGGKEKKITKSDIVNKLKVKVGSEVTINIKSTQQNNIERLQNGYLRFNFDNSDKYIDIKKNNKITTIKYKQKIYPTTKYLNVLFEHPYTSFFIITLIILAINIGIYLYLNKAINLYKKNGFDITYKIFLLKSLFGIGLFLFIYQQLVSPFWWLDTAFNAIVAKNIAFGYGYNYTFNGTTHEYPPCITTGFPAMFFVAAFIKIFSNTTWVPKLACSVLNLILLGITLYLPKYLKNITNIQLWGWRCLFIFFITYSINNGLGDLSYSSSLLGELPAFFLIIISTFILFFAENKKHLYFISGIIASLAYCTKIVSILSIGPIVFILIIYKLLQKENLKTLIANILIFISGFITPIAIFEIYKIITLQDLNNYIKLKTDEINFFEKAGSGLQQTIAEATIINKTTKLLHTVGITRFFIFLILPLCALYKSIKNYKNNSVIQALITALLFASWGNLIWWLLINSTGWLRHYFIGFAIFITAISLIIFIVNKKNKIIYIILALIFLTMPKCTELDIKIIDFHRFIKESIQENTDMTQAVEYINKNPNNKYFGIGHDAIYQMEYARKDSGHFYDITNDKTFKKYIQNKVLITSKKQIENNQYFDKNNQNIQKCYQENTQNNIIFSNEHFIFFKCN